MGTLFLSAFIYYWKRHNLEIPHKLSTNGFVSLKDLHCWVISITQRTNKFVLVCCVVLVKFSSLCRLEWNRRLTTSTLILLIIHIKSLFLMLDLMTNSFLLVIKGLTTPLVPTPVACLHFTRLIYMYIYKPTKTQL